MLIGWKTGGETGYLGLLLRRNGRRTMQTPEPSESNASASETPKDKECRYCREIIPLHATICRQCRYYQNKWRHNLVNMAHSVTLVGVILAGITMCNTRQEHIKAGQASRDAGTALQTAGAAATQASESAAHIETQRGIIDGIAQQARSASQAIEKISPQMQAVTTRLGITMEGLEAAEKRITHMNEIAEFTLQASLAQNDDCKAFDKLKVWMQDSNIPHASEARQVVQKIRENYSQNISTRIGGDPVLPWREGFDHLKLTLQQVIEEIFKKGNPYIKRASINYLWNREDFPKKKKLEFLISVIESDDNLSVVAEAERKFNSVSKQWRAGALAIDAQLDWWKKNEETIPEN
jgi:hypothetical protein